MGRVSQGKSHFGTRGLCFWPNRSYNDPLIVEPDLNQGQGTLAHPDILVCGAIVDYLPQNT
jgi:hypothetical protein